MFCSQCGGGLVPGAAFCPQCGQPVNPENSGARENAAEEPKPAAFDVTFTREAQRFAVNPDVKIAVDERDEYRIGNGETLRIPMAPGTHSVVFRCGIRNKAIELDVRQDLALRINWSRLTGSLKIE